MRNACLLCVCLTSVLSPPLGAQEPMPPVPVPKPVAAPPIAPPLPMPAAVQPPLGDRQRMLGQLDAKRLELDRLQALLEFVQKEVNQLEDATGLSTQVGFGVRIIEIDHDKVRQRGIKIVTAPNGENSDVLALLMGVDATGDKNAFSTIANKGRLQVIELLIKEQVAKVLAEPNLTVLNGHPASFLSGGDYDKPTIVTADNWIGTRMELLPNVMGNGRLRVDCRLETRKPDPVGGRFNGGGTTGRIQTQMEVQSGDTLLVCAPFRHPAGKKDRTSQVWLIKPEIVAPIRR